MWNIYGVHIDMICKFVCRIWNIYNMGIQICVHELDSGYGGIQNMDVLTPRHLRGPKVSSYSFKSNSKCCNFCIQCPNSINKNCWKIYILSFKLCGKIFRSIQHQLISWKPIKVHWFNLSLPNRI